MTIISVLCIIIFASGGLAERFKAPSWKGGEVQASVSSNLMSSASRNLALRNKGFLFRGDTVGTQIPKSKIFYRYEIA